MRAAAGRPGLSRTATEAILIMMAIMAAVALISYGKGSVGSATARFGAASSAHLQAMGGGVVDETAGSIYFVVYVRNLGPTPVGDPSLPPSEIPDMWQVFVNDAPCVVRRSYIRQHAPDPSLEDNAAMDVGEVWEFGFRCPKSSVQPSDRYEVAIYGPGGARVFLALQP